MNYDPSATIPSHEVVTEMLHVSFHNILPDYPLIRDNARIRVFEQAVGGAVIQVQSWILDAHKSDVRIERREIEFPATPWEFFKQSYAPAWFLKRWPVKTKTTTYDWSEHHHFVCPHVKVEDRGEHFKWMGRMSGQL
jgi:hypothetical protein